MKHEDLIEEIRSAVRIVFSTMLASEIEDVESCSGPQADEAVTEGVVAVVGIVGEYAGTGSISCSGLLARRLSSLMLMAEYESVNDDVLDAMGEVANMIIGNVKTNLEERFGPMGISTPAIIYGRNFCTHGVNCQNRMKVSFRCHGELFTVQMSLVRTKPDGTGSRECGPRHA